MNAIVVTVHGESYCLVYESGQESLVLDTVNKLEIPEDSKMDLCYQLGRILGQDFKRDKYGNGNRHMGQASI